MNAGAGTSTFPNTGATETLAERAKSGVLWLGIVNIASKGTQMAVTIALAAFLTESDLGLVTVVVSLINVAAVMQTLAVFEFIACAKGDERITAGTTLTISLAASTALTVFGVAQSSWIAATLGVPSAANLVAIAALSLPFTAIGGVQMAVMHRALDFRSRLLPDAGSALLGALLTISLAALGVGPVSLAIGLLVTAVLQPIFGYVVGARVRPRWDRAAATDAFRWIATIGPGAIIAVLLVNVDYPIISRVLGADAVGLYSLAFRIAWSPYIMVSLVLSSVAFSVFAALVRDGRHSDLPSALNRFTQLVLLAVGGMYLLIALMADRVELLGERWAPAATTLAVLCGYGIGLSLLQTWYDVLNVIGRRGLYLAYEIIRMIVLVAALLLYTKYGVTAAAFAQLAAVWGILPFVWLTMRRVNVAPSTRHLGRMLIGYLIPALTCVGVYLVMRWSGLEPEPTSWLGSIVELVVLLSCYLGVAALANRRLLGSLRDLRKVEAVQT